MERKNTVQRYEIGGTTVGFVESVSAAQQQPWLRVATLLVVTMVNAAPRRGNERRRPYTPGGDRD
jgi:hypothetical protein